MDLQRDAPDSPSPRGHRTSALALSILAGCVRRGGPVPSEYPQVTAVLSVLSIDRVSPERVAEVLAPTLTPECLHGWAYLRPLGRIGDHVVTERILTGAVSTDPRLAAWDAFCQAQPVARAVRNRSARLHELLGRLDDRRPLGAAVLVAGSGAAHDVHAYLAAHPESRLRVTCTEGHPPAAALAEARCRDLRQAVTIVPHEVEALRLRSRFDLVWAPAHGCCLDDRAWVALASRLYDLVAPDGALVVADVAAANPSRPYLEVVAGWFLAHRTADHLAALAHATAGPDAAVRVDGEPEGACLFTRIAARA